MRFLSKRALAFRRDVKHLFWDTKHPGFGPSARLSLKILLIPPDKRKRDMDNLLKGLLDSLEHAGVYDNDNQIDMLFMGRLPELGGRLELEINEIACSSKK